MCRNNTIDLLSFKLCKCHLLRNILLLILLYFFRFIIVNEFYFGLVFSLFNAHGLFLVFQLLGFVYLCLFVRVFICLKTFFFFLNKKLNIFFFKYTYYIIIVIFFFFFINFFFFIFNFIFFLVYLFNSFFFYVLFFFLRI